MRGTDYLIDFVRGNRKDFAYVPQAPRNMAVFSKVGRDQRDWMHFQGFGGSSKSYLTHALIRRMHLEHDSFFVRTARRVRDLLSDPQR